MADETIGNGARSVRSGRRPYAVLTELGRSLYDDALVWCETDREAAFVASARLVSILERALVKARRSPGGRPRRAGA